MKKLFLVLLTLTVFVGLFANKIQAPTYELSPTANITGAASQNREMWDILFTFNASAVSMPGTETDNLNIYTTTWNAGVFSRYEMDGTYLADFSIGGVSNIRDMAYDGTYFYGSPASMTIYIMDLANESLIGTIPVTCSGVTGVRHIAYDPGLDGGNGGFWVGNWAEFGAIAMDGSQIYGNIAGISDSSYGSAYDPWTTGGPYIWNFKQIGNGAEIHQFDIATQTLTGVTHDASDLPGFIAGSIAGGLATYVNSSGVFCMIANIQQETNLIGVYEIAVTADPSAPGLPTDVVLTPDVGGALEAVIDWVCPDVDVLGNPLSELDEMEVYRGEDLIYTDSSPTIGGAGTYTDAAVPASGNYTYTVVGNNSFGEGLPASVSSWIGEDVPNVVEDLLLVGEFEYGHLTWTNPTTGLNGGAFNNPILGYHIERNDGAMFEVTGLLTEFWDITIPGAASYYYEVTPYNAIGDGGTATSNTALLAAGGTLVMEDFSTWLPAGWTTTSSSGQVNWMQSQTNFAGGSVPEAVFYWSPSTVATQRLISPVLDTSGATELDLEFKHSISDYNGQYALYVQTTSDGTTWNDVLVIPTVSIGATTVTETVTTPDVGSATFQIAWVFDGDSYNINDWWVDDVMVVGDYTPPDPGYITGTVTLEGGTGDVEDVQVTAAYMTVNPDAAGFYEIEILPGTFDVTAILDGYEPDLVAGVVVDEGATTSDVDLVLEAIVGVDDEVIITTKLLNNYPNPFNPVTNIAYSINETGNVTIDVYNLKGQLVKSLVNEVIETGDHIVTWSGRDNSNKSVASGVYFYKMKSSNFTATKKMILMK